MSTLTWSCCPCWLWLASSSFDSMSAMAPARSSRRPRESVASLAELSADLRNQVLAWLPAVALARMQAASGPFADCGRAALSARGLASLRVLHWLEAQALSFAWGGGAGIDALQVSGDDGWLTEFGSARITCTEVAALDAARPRCRWELELLRHDGLLVVGVADERMQDNVFVGVFSDGGWASVGWELPHQGGLQPVDSSRLAFQAESGLCSAGVEREVARATGRALDMALPRRRQYPTLPDVEACGVDKHRSQCAFAERRRRDLIETST